MYPEWKQGSNYNTGDIVVHKGILYRAKQPLSQSELEPSINQSKNFFWTVVSEDCQSNNEAEKLLVEVCKHIELYPESHAIWILTDCGTNAYIKGLQEWWDTHKLKTEREQNLEKVQALLKTWWPDGMDSPQARMADEILTLLGL